MSNPKELHIVFDGSPGPVAGRFVEVEDEGGCSIAIGEWNQRDDGFWHLVIPYAHVEPAIRELARMGRALGRAQAVADAQRTAIMEANGHLGAALMQTVASDDEIIVDHIRSAEAILSTALKGME